MTIVTLSFRDTTPLDDTDTIVTQGSVTGEPTFLSEYAQMFTAFLHATGFNYVDSVTINRTTPDFDWKLEVTAARSGPLLLDA